MWLVIDSNYLAHRAYHAMKGLSHEGDSTGMLFGFLRDVRQLDDQFRPSRTFFCFDRGRGARREVYPGYKADRDQRYEDATPEEQDGIKEFRGQVRKLARYYLPTIGYRNIISQPGYEADDHIAAVVDVRKAPVVIVSADQDLWQLLAADVTQYNPQTGRVATVDTLQAEYGLLPSQWVMVKAIAGCKSDNVPGVAGVGEKTAAKWILGKLNPTTKTCQNIDAAVGMIARNMQLVSLPFGGTEVPRVLEDHVTRDGWRQVLKELGIRSLDVADPAAKPKGIRDPKGRRNLGL